MALAFLQCQTDVQQDDFNNNSQLLSKANDKCNSFGIINRVKSQCTPPEKSGCTIVVGARTYVDFAGSGEIPACEGNGMWVDYDYQICQNSNNVVESVNIFNLSTWPLGYTTNCPELNEYLNTLVNDPSGLDGLDAALEIIEYFVSLTIEYDLVNLNIGTATGCPTSIDATYYENKCYKWCQNYLDGSLFKVSCGNVCCIRSTEYCRIDGVLKSNGWSYELLNADNDVPCGGIIPGEQCWRSSSCDHDCGPVQAIIIDR